MSDVKSQIAKLLESVTVADIPSLVEVEMPDHDQNLALGFENFSSVESELRVLVVEHALAKAGYGTVGSVETAKNEIVFTTNMPYSFFSNWCAQGRT